ncbi:MAG TPA: enolase C-terminal domain-like protein [Solirubrobacteraceae bacterium]|nr:enolase C-terminal domain-like protein [Solirubrobacteraceae bacterium]
MKLEIAPVHARLRAPFVSAWGSVVDRSLLLVRIESVDGVSGFGEAAPLPSYDGVTIDDVRAALEDCRETLRDGDERDRASLLRACTRRAVLPQAVAAVDLALWDLEGRRRREPVWRLLGAPAPAPVEVNATIASSDRAGAAAEAAAARAAGFRCAKVKVGLGDDAGRLAAVRAAAGRELAIRLDANGAWTAAEATATLRVLEPVGIELCEEPVSGLDQLAAVCAQTRIAVALDESSALPGALEERHCTAVCLKISRFGGITGLLDAAVRARAAGYEVYLASTLDGPLGIAAALHAAAALGPDRPCGLATLPTFDGRPDPLPAAGGRMRVADGPGLGDGLIGWYASDDAQ